MDWVTWLIFGVVVILAILFFSVRSELDRRAKKTEASDPELAIAMQKIRNQIDKGGTNR